MTTENIESEGTIPETLAQSFIRSVPDKEEPDRASSAHRTQAPPPELDNDQIPEDTGGNY